MITTADGAPIERSDRNIVWDNHRWQHFTHRPRDIFVCTPPKCGTTWMQTIVATLLFPDGGMAGPVMDVAPWLDARFEPIEDVVDRLDAQTHRRSIKTHTPAYGIPWYDDVSYIVVGRDGRDAFMSFHNHMTHMRPEVVMAMVTSAMEEGIDLGPMPPLDDIHEFYAWWLEGGTWFHHCASFWDHHDDPDVLFVHYDEMLEDLEREMRRVSAFLEVEVDESRWTELVDRCTFASMKSRSAEIGDFDRTFVGGAQTFLYRGTNGRWRDVLRPEELDAFDRRSEELLPADAIAWLTAREPAAG